ncbi:MAG: tail protein X [Oscillospiraceae bacterium]|nr:tail protein X [Oscillospiraceae bacterium]
MKTTEGIYLCSAGESFDLIALQVYGHEKYAAELLCANPSLCRIPVFSGGERLTLPSVELPEETGYERYAPARAPWKE